MQRKQQPQVTRQKIRNAIRSVMFNRMWLLDTDEQKLTLNVKKNIAMLIRSQQRIGLLNMVDKSALRTQPDLRTIEDRKRLINLIAHLQCFSNLSPKVRARLVPIITFLYVEPGRVIIRQGDIPRYVYFILTGEVEVLEQIWDPMENDYIDQVVSIAGPGECFGELDFIRGCSRKNTYIARSNAEFLVVFEDDFDLILREEITKHWMEKKTSFEALHYFDNFTEDQILKGCKLAELRQFDPLETIYYEDKGQISHAYFIVSGECVILQCLKLKVTERDDKKYFELVDISNDPSEGLFQGFKSEDAQKGRDDSYDIDEEIKSEDDFKNTFKSKKPKRVIQNKTLQEIEIICQQMKDKDKTVRYSDDGSNEHVDENINVNQNDNKEISEMNEEVKTSETPNAVIFETETGSVEEEEDYENFENYEHFETTSEFETDYTETIDAESSDYYEDLGFQKSFKEYKFESIEQVSSVEEFNKEGSTASRDKIDADLKSIGSNYEKLYGLTENRSNIVQAEEADMNLDTTGENAETVTEEIATPSKKKVPTYDMKLKLMTKRLRKKKTVQVRFENRFIDVGSLLFGGIFGLGEKLEHRVIMARSTVQCLLIPRYWLFESLQNPGNIWQRRQFYLNTCIPSRQRLFSGFLRERTWHKFKDAIVKRVLENAVSGNPTKMQDIPIICRIVAASND